MLKLNKNNNLNYYSTILAFLLLSFSIILFLSPNVILAAPNPYSNKEQEIKKFDHSDSKAIQTKSDKNSSVFEFVRRIIKNEKFVDEEKKIVKYTRKIEEDTIKVFKNDKRITQKELNYLLISHMIHK
ncbi:hypothetical protein [Candidatus Phytoplasma palmae]|uniref:hypothetical protein n=1 Tax=Candidatus Phytoplasma palmae TaxID=85624 RepID=UPI003990B118